MKAIARRLKKLEDLEIQQRDSGPSLVAVLLARRRRRAIAEGREPEPDPPPEGRFDSSGKPLLISEILRKRWRKSETN
jgi:hypothetical protein